MKTKDPNNIHPQDMKNMFIFFLGALLIYYSYHNFIVVPRRNAIQAQKQIEMDIQAEKEGHGPEKPLPRAAALALSPRISVDNGVIYGSIALKGGKIDDISLHDYYEELAKKTNVAVLSPVKSDFPRYIEYGWVPADTATRVPDSETMWRVEGNDKLTKDAPVRLVWDNGAGLCFERVYSIDDNFMITVNQKVINNSGKRVELHPYGLLTQAGMPPHFQGVWISHEGPMGYIGEQLVEVKYGKLLKEPSFEYSGRTGWTGITDKYWLAALIPPQAQDMKFRINRTGDKPIMPAKRGDRIRDPGRYQVDYTGTGLVLEPGQSGESQSMLFAGAKRVLTLGEYEKKYNIPEFDLAVDFGWFWFFTKPLFYALHYLDLYIGNMGIAIIIVTIVLRAMVFPLTNVSYKSFAKMKKVSPQVMELRKAAGDDKKKLQEELVKLYEREGVNPMAGCFPMLVQIPIFFSLYKTLFVTIEMRHAPFFGWITDLSEKDPTNVFNLFGLINWVPPDFLHVGVWPLLLMLMMYIQQKLNPPPQDPIQRDMAIYMPIMLCYIMAKFAAGLVIYWTFSALIGVIQQIIIMRSLGVPVHLFGETEAEKKMDKAVAEGPAVHPLIEMAEKDVKHALGADGNTDPNTVPPPTVTPPKPRRKKKK